MNVFETHEKSEGGTNMLFPRLERAAMNQVNNGVFTTPRYGIWASTVNNCLHEALQQTESSQPEEAKRQIIKAINTISAFKEIQALFDPWQNGEGR
jgi:hypothetical protein